MQTGQFYAYSVHFKRVMYLTFEGKVSRITGHNQNVGDTFSLLCK